WFALRNLARSRLRSFLTMLGIFIGIAAVVSLVSLSQGLKTSIAEQFDKIGADKIFVSLKGTQTGAFADVSSRALTNDDAERIRRVGGVGGVSSYLREGATVESGDEQGVFAVLTLPEESDDRRVLIDTASWELASGKWFDKDDAAHVVVGSDVTNAGLFKKQVALGSKITVQGRTFEVAGVLKKIGDPDTDSGIIMAESTGRELFSVPETVSAIIVQTAKGADPLVVADAIKRSLRTFRGVDKGKEDFDLQTPEDILQTLNQVLDIIQVVLVGIAAISLFVGGVGIMNTMYTAVLERTGEIGVMKAVGARNSDILAIFVAEAGFLGVVGGIIGTFFGMGIAYAVKVGAAIALGTELIQVFFPWYLVAGVLAFAFIIGSLSGALPAYQASRLPPVEALRYE
ncbi:MAG: ABC transporter permease, partial [Nanoarchaeota archaeon]